MKFCPCKYRKWILAAFGLWLLSVFVWKSPLRYSVWDEDVRVLAGVEMLEDGSGVNLTKVRNWTYTDLDLVASKNYFDQTYKFEDLENMYFYVQPLSKSGLIAHTFVVFEFAQDYGDYRHLGISVETRRQLGEEYSIIGGIFNKFEITHTWATEKDLVDRRTVYMDYELQKYEVVLSDREKQAVFRAFLKPTKDLAAQPKFYNTLFYNCTNVLAYYVNRVSPDSIPFHYSFILTGKAGAYLERLGYLK